jgi:glycosyltransferase involved in cell wall biosynthesis
MDIKMNNIPKLAIIIPCFNEEEVVRETASRLITALREMSSQSLISDDSIIYFVDDGSRDKTWATIKDISKEYPVVKGLKLSRNFGQQNALLAGLMNVKRHIDCAITLDADLQDDITVIPKFIEHFKSGAEIVYGVRSQRNSDSLFKKYSALAFYKLMKVMGVNIIHNHSDYRLCSKRVMEHLFEFEETNLFLRGIFPSIGFKTSMVYYERGERFAGETKYPLKKMIAFAFNGISSFSTVPLRLITFIGFIIFISSLLMIGYILAANFMGHAIPGWTSTLLPIYFIGGVQIFCTGLIGEYIGKIYKETKRRPRFIKDEEIS